MNAPTAMRPLIRSIRQSSRQIAPSTRPLFRQSFSSHKNLAKPVAAPICLSCQAHARLRAAYSTKTGGGPPSSPSSSSSPTGPNAAPSTSTSATPESTSGRRTDQSSAPPPPPSSSPPPEDEAASDSSLPSAAESRRSALSVRFSTFMDNVQGRAVVASQKLNDLTGYTAIEAIKRHNAELEAELAAAQARLRAARTGYKALTERRAASQREVTTLLARKDTWAPPELERFTALYREGHALDQEVAGAGAELAEAEGAEQRLSAELNAGILRRYHEEQIWSDRIRQASTWGTWGLMGVNILLFLALQFVAEPWRRARLVRGVVEREEQTLAEVRKELGAVRAALEANSGGTAPRQAVHSADEVAIGNLAVEETALPRSPAPASSRSSEVAWWEFLREPRRWGSAVADLGSERRSDLRMRDATVLAMESAAIGAAIAASVAFALLQSR